MHPLAISFICSGGIFVLAGIHILISGRNDKKKEKKKNQAHEDRWRRETGQLPIYRHGNTNTMSMRPPKSKLKATTTEPVPLRSVVVTGGTNVESEAVGDSNGNEPKPPIYQEGWVRATTSAGPSNTVGITVPPPTYSKEVGEGEQKFIVN